MTVKFPEPAAASETLRIPRLVWMFRALGHRNFRLFFIGQLISLTGTWMQVLAQSWLVYRLTHSAAVLGAVGFSMQVPILLLGPVAGIVADRYPRHRIILFTQTAMMVQAIIISILTLTEMITVEEIFLLAVWLGVCTAFDIPARQAFLVEMVGSQDLMNAIALNSSMFNGARLVGPALAGFLVAALGEGMCFLINGVSYGAVITVLLMMKINRNRPALAAGGKLEQLKEGFSYAFNHRAIRGLLLLLGVMSLMGMSYIILLPIFADQVLHSGARGLGWLMTAAGFGALVAALWLAGRAKLSGLSRLVVIAATGFAVSLILFGMSRSLWVSALILVPVGFCLMVQMAATNTLIQSLVSDSMRGRIMALYSMMFLGMAPFGSLLSGFLAHRFGAPAAVIFGGFLCLVGIAIFGTRLRRIVV